MNRLARLEAPIYLLAGAAGGEARHPALLPVAGASEEKDTDATAFGSWLVEGTE
jgi:hypothetical protein